MVGLKKFRRTWLSPAAPERLKSIELAPTLGRVGAFVDRNP
jgi:hypothetical protein